MLGHQFREGKSVTSRCLLALAIILFTPALHAQNMADHTYTSATITTGSRVYLQRCALCHGPDGGWVEDINLARGKFKSVVTDKDLIEIIHRGAGDGRMPAFNLTEEEMEGIVAFIRTGFDPDGEAVIIGNMQRGKQVFNGKGECSSCHRVQGIGPRSAPDLSDIAFKRTPAMLQRTLTRPASSLMPINRPIEIETAGGEVIRGRRLNEDTYTVQIIDGNERLLTFEKASLRRFGVSTTPTHTPTTLPEDDVADLLGFLLSLRGNAQ